MVSNVSFEYVEISKGVVVPALTLLEKCEIISLIIYKYRGAKMFILKTDPSGSILSVNSHFIKS